MSDMLATHCLMQPRTPFSCFTATAHCCSQSPLSILDPTDFLPNNNAHIDICDSSFPSFLYFSLVTFISFPSVHFSCLLVLFRMVSATSPVLCHQQICWSALCTIIWLINDHAEQECTQYCPMWCIAGYWPPARPRALSSTLWAWPFNQFSLQFTVCPSSPYINLSVENPRRDEVEGFILSWSSISCRCDSVLATHDDLLIRFSGLTTHGFCFLSTFWEPLWLKAMRSTLLHVLHAIGLSPPVSYFQDW